MQELPTKSPTIFVFRRGQSAKEPDPPLRSPGAPAPRAGVLFRPNRPSTQKTYECAGIVGKVGQLTPFHSVEQTEPISPIMYCVNAGRHIECVHGFLVCALDKGCVTYLLAHQVSPMHPHAESILDLSRIVPPMSCVCPMASVRIP